MRKLSKIRENDFTVKLLDIFIPDVDPNTNAPLSYIFLVMEYFHSSLAQLLDKNYQKDQKCKN